MHEDGVWVHGKVQEGTGAERDGRAREGAGDPERDNGARGRCTGAREGAGDRGRAR